MEGINTRPGEKGWGHQRSECSGDVSTDYRVCFFCLYFLVFLLYRFLKPSKRRMIIKERETNMTHDSTRKRKEWKAMGDEDNTEYGQKKPGHKGKGNFSSF